MKKATRKSEGFKGQRLIVLPLKIQNEFLVEDPITRQIFITDIGYYPTAQYHYVERPQGISQHIIIYCVNGHGWVEIDNKKIDVRPSQFITIPSDKPHRYGSNTNDPWTIYWIHFKGETSAYIVDLILDNVKNYKPILAYDANRIKLFEEIYTNLEKGYSADTLRYVNMTFSHFLSSLLYEDKFNNMDKAYENHVIALTIELMQRRISEMISLNEFASFAKLSVSHFSLLFRTKTGHAPIEYFNHLKVQKACQYLSFTRMTIKEIANSLGIDDQYYFSRMFSKLMEIPPTAYRKRNVMNI
ncbi:AraC-like ligand binding domain-containing protein [Dyadobacter sp. SG02]|uniref:AraC family transcriptional regulator n=1 Tax=Dyadobacter sp. SG02 TaxID=1855291 RepID=UPI0008C1F558|nr:AraC family transcriptional regulator [Dyadobacter sp. SG02]SEJ75603.1 AraC-like ligand binding domain-containing protein [Dyadobacter sp. SG02]